MRKLLLFAASLFAAIFITSCGETTVTSTNDSDSVQIDSLDIEEALQFKTIHFRDSMDQGEATNFFDLEIQFPVSGNPALVKSISRWIDRQLGGSYEGELLFDDDMMRHYAGEYFSEIDNDGSQIGWSYDCSITIDCDTDRFVSLQLSSYDYTGGAHGMPICYGVTFDKQTGHPYGWDLFADTTALAPIIKRELLSYFAASLEEPVDSIQQFIFEDAAANFPRPNTAPWLTCDGIRFIYGAYEIAPYSAGMPEVTIKPSTLTNYLSEKAKELLR